MICASGSTAAVFSPSPGNRRAIPMPTMPTTTTTSNTAPASVLTRRASRQAAPSPSWRRDSMNTGINADDSAPSPNSARNKLGMRKATTKEDMASDVPNRLAVRMSRIMPRMRLNIVNPPTLAANRMTLRFSIRSYFPAGVFSGHGQSAAMGHWGQSGLRA